MTGGFLRGFAKDLRKNGDDLRKLNNVFAQETSYLESQMWDHLVEQARFSYAAGSDGFLLAFDQDADYQSPNFLWHRDRMARFVYIDRVVIAAEAQGRGLGRQLYEQLFTDARAAGYPVVACEVNVVPPNPVSIAFHERLGFAAVGEQAFGGDKIVRYYVATL